MRGQSGRVTDPAVRARCVTLDRARAVSGSRHPLAAADLENAMPDAGTPTEPLAPGSDRGVHSALGGAVRVRAA
jgi:hypothetical protein